MFVFLSGRVNISIHMLYKHLPSFNNSLKYLIYTKEFNGTKVHVFVTFKWIMIKTCTTCKCAYYDKMLGY